MSFGNQEIWDVSCRVCTLLQPSIVKIVRKNINGDCSNINYLFVLFKNWNFDLFISVNVLNEQQTIYLFYKTTLF